jgi:hypothetical protein
MQSWLKRLVASRSRVLNRALGDVVSERDPIHGTTTKHSYAKCRLKQSVDGRQCFISMEFKHDYVVGPEGSPKYWIDFDLASAERLRESLDSCIAELKARSAAERP